MVPGDSVKATAAGADGGAEGKEEVSLWIGLKIEAESVKRRGQLPVVIKVLIKVRLAVAIQVMQACDLVVANGVNLVIHDPESKRLVQPGGEAFPCEVVEVIVDARDHPDIAGPGA